jgi:hypothetical protein
MLYISLADGFEKFTLIRTFRKPYYPGPGGPALFDSLLSRVVANYPNLSDYVVDISISPVKHRAAGPVPADSGCGSGNDQKLSTQM